MLVVGGAESGQQAAEDDQADACGAEARGHLQPRQRGVDEGHHGDRELRHRGEEGGGELEAPDEEHGVEVVEHAEFSNRAVVAPPQGKDAGPLAAVAERRHQQRADQLPAQREPSRVVPALTLIRRARDAADAREDVRRVPTAAHVPLPQQQVARNQQRRHTHRSRASLWSQRLVWEGRRRRPMTRARTLFGRVGFAGREKRLL
mmetsp:Transcript_41692/g.138188  ORF Transcript_41692/g.138188 Transcript_41692/m.138188 type:complete len:204 (-) Transcript_41692:138-749(-)